MRKISPKNDPSPEFEDFARHLLFGCQLSIGDSKYRICEIEFYYSHPAHPDPFTHGNEIQRQNGTWYVHRKGKKASNNPNCGPSRGIDLTIGDGESYGGILFRAIRPIDGGALIEGPIKVVQHMAEILHLNINDLEELDVALRGKSVLSKDCPISIEEFSNDLAKTPILKTPRGGLELKKIKESSFQNALGFILAPYRFIVHPKNTKKHPEILVAVLHRDGATVPNIQSQSILSLKRIERVKGVFEKGRANGMRSLPELVQSWNKYSICEVLGAQSIKKVNS